MSVINYDVTRPQKGGYIRVVSWSGLVDADTGDPFEILGPAGTELCVQVVSTTGGATTMQVSNDGTVWETMTDEAGNDVTVTSGGTGIFNVKTAARYCRPFGGASLTDDEVVMVVREALD